MTVIPQPNDLTEGYTATWDAWNRLVQVDDAGDVGNDCCVRVRWQQSADRGGYLQWWLSKSNAARLLLAAIASVRRAG